LHYGGQTLTYDRDNQGYPLLEARVVPDVLEGLLDTDEGGLHVAHLEGGLLLEGGVLARDALGLVLQVQRDPQLLDHAPSDQEGEFRI